MSAGTRLSAATLPLVPESYRPTIETADLRIGMIHLGVGAFHRAHQAVYTEDAIAAAGGDWGIEAFTQRSAAVVEQLAPQDCLYTVFSPGADRPVRVIGALRRVGSAADDPDRVVGAIAREDTKVVTLTVTEKGYRHDPATGRLRRDDDLVRADLAGAPPRSTIGQLVRGLELRRANGNGPVTIVSCDNLPSNGATLQGLVLEFCAASDAAGSAALAEWIEQQVSFPSTMVDRIVPATTADDRSRCADLLGLQDAAMVTAEPFSQWVIQDDFAAGRPAWDEVGATLTDDVAPYETAKLRLLNGTHSALAYLGGTLGLPTIAAAMSDDTLASFAQRLQREAAATISPPPGVDLSGYADRILARFADPTLRHRCDQVAMDGSQKMPQRLLGTIRDQLTQGVSPDATLTALAGWLHYLRVRASAGLPLDDPLAEQLGAALRPGRPIGDVFSIAAVFGDLADERAVTAGTAERLDLFDRAGPAAAAGQSVAAGPSAAVRQPRVTSAG